MKIEFNRKAYISCKSIDLFPCLKCAFEKSKCPTFIGRCPLASKEFFVHTNSSQLFKL